MSRETNKDLPKLLRAMAASEDAKLHKHDVIYSAAADELQLAWDTLKRLQRSYKHFEQASTVRKSVGEGETCYTPEDVEKARTGLIMLRNKALEVGMMDWTVLLSHTIAVLAVMKRELFQEP